MSNKEYITAKVGQVVQGCGRNHESGAGKTGIWEPATEMPWEKRTRNTNDSCIYREATVFQACLWHFMCLVSLKGEKLRRDFMEGGRTKTGMEKNA